MDFKNKSIPADSVTSFDVNKAIQRSLTKAVARHGIGLYIYAGEDLPEGEEPKKATAEQVKKIKELTPDESVLNAMLKYFGVKALADLTEEQANVAIARRKESEGKE